MRMAQLLSSLVCLARPVRGLLYSPAAVPSAAIRSLTVHGRRFSARSLSAAPSSGSETREGSGGAWRGAPPQPAVARVGDVVVEQKQRVLKLDAAALEAVLRRLLVLTGCAHMDVGLCLTNDANIRKLNAQYRGMPKSTDILSFPNHNALAIDGDFPGDPTTFAQTEDGMNLGDMVVSVPYVLRCLGRDALEASEVGPQAWARDRQETRGVSGAMMGYLGGRSSAAEAEAVVGPLGAATRKPSQLSGARLAALEARVALLLAHGLLHLLGHDHEHTADPEGGEDGGEGGDKASPPAEGSLSAAQEARVEAMYGIMVAEEERLVAGLRDLLPPEG